LIGGVVDTLSPAVRKEDVVGSLSEIAIPGLFVAEFDCVLGSVDFVVKVVLGGFGFIVRAKSALRIAISREVSLTTYSSLVTSVVVSTLSTST